MLLRLWVPVAASLLFACAAVPITLTGAERRETAQQRVREAGWHWLALESTDTRWALAAAVSSQHPPTERLTVYIEGDGLAWLGSTRVSPDPTPVHPLGLDLALQDSEPAAWLARPCQYTFDAPACEPRWWTTHRFGPDMVAAMDTGLDALKRRTGARELVLVGYSGGGALAVLLADRRSDVVGLATVAGNLDTDEWTRRLGLTRLSGSLNPANVATQVTHIPQIHFVGDLDTVMPREVAVAYETRSRQATSRLQVVAGADHTCCWRERWPELARRLPRRATASP